MTHGECIERLSARLDGELLEREAGLVEAHLEACASCRGVALDLEGVRAAARELPPSPAAPDLWPEIAARLDEAEAGATAAREGARGRRCLVLSWPQAAAAAAVAAVAIGGAWWLARPPAPSPEPAAKTARGESLGDASGAHYAALSGEIVDLKLRLERDGDRLDPETVRILRKNLRLIEQALRESRAALASDPTRAEGSSRFAASLSGKVELLRQAADAALLQADGS